MGVHMLVCRRTWMNFQVCFFVCFGLRSEQNEFYFIEFGFQRVSIGFCWKLKLRVLCVNWARITLPGNIGTVCHTGVAG